MERVIAMPAEDRKQLCEQTAARLGLTARSVEKDFWVCWTLQGLFGLVDWGPQLTFKGGTSLSKAWKLIDRFSEDIDVVISRGFLGFGGDQLTANRINKLRKKCRKAIHEELGPVLEGRFKHLLPKEIAWSLRPASPEEDSDQLTLLFGYPSVFPATETYMRQVVKIEMGARSDTEPCETAWIQPYVAEAFPELAGISSFSLRTVAARRTFWEKAMLLHEQTFHPAGERRKARLARHYYDLWCLIKRGVASEAAQDRGLFERVAKHRQIFFKLAGVDYSTLRKGTLRLMPPQEQLADWQSDYRAMHTEMFIGTPPTFDEVLAAVRQFEQEFNRS
jgi:predicted nucleotidyltransferase component of viral defense system